MKLIKNFIERIRARRQLGYQMLFTAIAFIVMVSASTCSMNNTIKDFLSENSTNFIDFMNTKIESDKKEPKAALEGFLRAARYMILRGSDIGALRDFMSGTNGYLTPDSERVSNYTGVYGVFKIKGNWAFIHSRGYKLPEGYDIEKSEWYSAAMEAGGEVVETLTYYDPFAEKWVFAYSHCIYDNSRELLGVACISVPLEDFGQYVVTKAKERKGGYGVLLDQNLRVIAHENAAFNGLYIYDPIIPLKKFRKQLEAGENVDSTGDNEFRTYRNERAVVYFKKMSNGWYIGIVALTNPYFKDMRNLNWSIRLIALICTIALILILISIDDARVKADALNRQKSAFLANMSHEIRTPMNAILGISEIQLANESLPPDTIEALGKIHNSGSIMLGIINDILDLSKIESGKMELVPGKYEIASVINDTVQLNMMRFESKPVEFRLELDETIPRVLYGDDLRIKQILNNLLSNAAKYTSRGEVEMTVAVEPGKPGASEVILVFYVRDTGVGMTAEQVRLIFDEYTRFNTEANRTTEGTGLGMSITQKLVQMMGGDIFVESVPGKGSLFKARLPQEVLDASALGRELAESLKQFRASIEAPKRKAQFVRKHMPYGSVLVVDDVQTNLYVAKGLMLPYGLKFDTANSGFEAIEKIKSGNLYDIVFMDHMMPEMDGIEATKIIRSLGYNHPIVALTANAIAGQADVFLANGFDAFLSKPIDVRQLNTLLNKLVRDKHPKESIGDSSEINEKTFEGPRPQADVQFAGVAVRDLEKSIAVLETAGNGQDAHGDEAMNLYTINFHSIKSVLANIGEDELSNAAFRLEDASRKKDIAAISANMPSFMESLRAAIERIRPLEEKYAAREETDEDKDYLHNKLIAIKDACEAYDIGAAESALAELNKKTWSGQTRDTLNHIGEFLLHSDFEEAAAAAANYSLTL
ncbi:MAG: response regulator [Holophagales bacterium]|nr:response regulator [Holophagales bacterium]